MVVSCPGGQLSCTAMNDRFTAALSFTVEIRNRPFWFLIKYLVCVRCDSRISVVR